VVALEVADENNMASSAAGMSQTAGLRQRFVPEEDSEWDPSLPYGGKVFLARRKKPDPFHIRAIEVKNIMDRSSLTSQSES